MQVAHCIEPVRARHRVSSASSGYPFSARELALQTEERNGANRIVDWCFAAHASELGCEVGCDWM